MAKLQKRHVYTRRVRVVCAATLALGVWVGLAAPIKADEFGQHARPWARDLQALGPAPSCDVLTEAYAAGRIMGDFSPMPPIAYEPGERALAIAAARAADLDAFAAQLDEARVQLQDTAVALRGEAQELEALRASVAAEIARLEGVEDMATQRRVDMLRNVRPKRAAELLADDDPQLIAQLLAPMAPRESAAIISAMPVGQASDVFDAMAPLTEAGSPDA